MKATLSQSISSGVMGLVLSISLIHVPESDMDVQNPPASVVMQKTVEAGGIKHVFKKTGRLVEKTVSKAANKASDVAGPAVGVVVGVAVAAGVAGAVGSL